MEKQASDWSVATLCAHAQLIDIWCCSSQPEPALTDQSRHRERCNSRSRARRTVLATFGKLLRFFQKSLDLSLGAKWVWKVAKSSDKVAKLATLDTCLGVWCVYLNQSDTSKWRVSESLVWLATRRWTRPPHACKTQWENRAKTASADKRKTELYISDYLGNFLPYIQNK